MSEKLSLDDKVDRMMVDLASVKTDVTWLKRLFIGMFLPVMATIAITVETGMI